MNSRWVALWGIPWCVVFSLLVSHENTHVPRSRLPSFDYFSPFHEIKLQFCASREQQNFSDFSANRTHFCVFYFSIILFSRKTEERVLKAKRESLSEANENRLQRTAMKGVFDLFPVAHCCCCCCCFSGVERLWRATHNTGTVVLCNWRVNEGAQQREKGGVSERGQYWGGEWKYPKFPISTTLPAIHFTLTSPAIVSYTHKSGCCLLWIFPILFFCVFFFFGVDLSSIGEKNGCTTEPAWQQRQRERNMKVQNWSCMIRSVWPPCLSKLNFPFSQPLLSHLLSLENKTQHKSLMTYTHILSLSLCRRRRHKISFSACSSAIESAIAFSLNVMFFFTLQMNEIEFAIHSREMRWSLRSELLLNCAKDACTVAVCWNSAAEKVHSFFFPISLHALTFINEIFSAWNCFHCDSKWKNCNFYEISSFFLPSLPSARSEGGGEWSYRCT